MHTTYNNFKNAFMEALQSCLASIILSNRLLSLFGMEGDTFIPLSFLDQIFSAHFFSKISIFCGGENWHESVYFDTLPSSLSLVKVAHRSSNNELFSCFHMSCQTGLSVFLHIYMFKACKSKFFRCTIIACISSV